MLRKLTPFTQMLHYVLWKLSGKEIKRKGEGGRERDREGGRERDREGG